MRHQFGAGVADFAVQPADGLWGVAAHTEITFWDAPTDGTQYTDLLDEAGSPITSVTTTEHGALPRFQGPDGVTGMWADAGGGSRAWMGAHDVSGGSGGGYTSITRIVASATAPADVRAAAQYVCDGVADQEEIQAALDDARDNGGGEILLTVGEFNLTAPLSIEGTDDVDVEIGIALRGQGARATMLNAGPGLSSVINLTKVVRVHLADFGLTIGGATDGITSSTTSGPASGHRSFWNSSFKGIQINGPWDGSHTGWAINMGSPFRSVFENIEVGGTGNGIRFYSEHDAFNPGDCVLSRVFVDLVGDNGTAYKIESTTNDGVMNQIEFIMCEAIASGTGCTGIHITGVGGWGTSHCHFQGINLEEFDKLIDVEYGSGCTFRLNHVGLRYGESGLTAFTFGENSFNNSILSCGLLYVTEDTVLVDDGNTMEPYIPNRVLNTRVYTEGAYTVTESLNPAGTTVRHTVVHTGSGTSSVKSTGDLQVAVKATDTSRASTATPTPDPHLVLPVAAGATYDVELVAAWTNGGGGFRATWAVPAGSSMVWTDNDGAGVSTPTGQVTFSVTTGTTFKGTLVVGSTEGTIGFSWAQNSSNAGATVLHAGCSLRLRRIA